MCIATLDSVRSARHSEGMHSGRRRSEGPAPRRASYPRWATLAVVLAAVSCGEPAEDESSSGNELQSGESVLYDELDTELLLGGQTGDGTGIAEDNADGECLTPGESQLLALDVAPRELGFSAADLLGWVQTGVSSSLSWSNELETSPETGVGSVLLRFEYDAGSARLHLPASSATGASMIPCSPWLEVDVVAAISTGGGALSERFVATLRASRPDVVGFSGTIVADELVGSLEVRSAGANEQLYLYEVAGMSTPFGSFGAISARFGLGAAEEGAFVEDIQRTVAVWPADGECPLRAGRGVALPGDAVIWGASAARWARVFDSAPPSPLRWNDGAETLVELDVQATSALCYWTSWSSDIASLTYAAQIAARTADRRWTGNYVGLAGVASRAEVDPTRAGLAVVRSVPPEQLPSLGVTTPSGVAADEMILQLGLQRELGKGTLNGQLQVTATRDLECTDQGDRLTDECLVARNIELVSANIGNGGGLVSGVED
jgi:hypothetical protein